MMAPEAEVMTAAKAAKDIDPRILSSLPQPQDVTRQEERREGNGQSKKISIQVPGNQPTRCVR